MKEASMAKEIKNASPRKRKDDYILLWNTLLKEKED